MSLSALNLGFSSLPMGLFNKEAGQESSHGVNHENNKKLGHSYNTHPSGSETGVCVCVSKLRHCVSVGLRHCTFARIRHGVCCVDIVIS